MRVLLEAEADVEGVGTSRPAVLSPLNPPASAWQEWKVELQNSVRT